MFADNKRQFQFVFDHTDFGGPSECYDHLMNYYSIEIALLDQAYCKELMIKNLNTDIYKIDILDLIHEMGHFIYNYLFEFIYNAPLDVCQDIVINNEQENRHCGLNPWCFYA